MKNFGFKQKNILVFFILVALLPIPNLRGQKKIIDFKAIEEWPDLPHAANCSISPNGTFVAWMVISGKTKTLNIKSINIDWQLSFPNATWIGFTKDDKKAIFYTGDSLSLLTLGKNEKEFIPNVKKYYFLTDSEKEWLIYSKENTEKGVFLRDPGSDSSYNYPSLTSIHFLSG